MVLCLVFSTIAVIGELPAKAGIAFRVMASRAGLEFEGRFLLDRRSAVEGTKPFGSNTRSLLQKKRWADATATVVFDYDGDGDLDIYVANSRGVPNSLYENRNKEPDVFEFRDVSSEAGVEATDMDCVAVIDLDVDGDGDRDLLVFGQNGYSRLYRNEGRGHFVTVEKAYDGARSN